MSDPIMDAARAAVGEAPDVRPIVPGFDLVGASQGLWAPLEPLEFVVEGIVPRASIGLLGGYSSSLKSWLALDLALSVGAGIPWLRHDAYACERGAVTYLDKEAGLYEIRRRLLSIRQPMALAEDPQLDVCAFPRGTIHDPDFVSRLTALCHTRRLVVLDTLAAFNSGVDENSAEMADGLGALAKIANDTKCAVVLVAHEKKRGNNATDGDARERIRGSSSIFGAADWVISCQRSEPREPVDVVQTKARNGREAEPFSVAMLDVPGGVTFKVEPKADDAPKSPAAVFEQKIAGVVAYARSNPRCSKRALRQSVGGRASVVDDAIAEATERGLLHALNGKLVAT
ncbi:MAG: AAA family ATPase [Myxococcales bacterium]|nr:AAA family ATPase [Myxococcales bacterium]